MQTTANEAVLTPCLTRDDVLVHDGPDGVPVGYRKVARRAQVGDLVLWRNHIYKVWCWSNGDMYVEEVGGRYDDVIDGAYLVLEPLDPALYHVHDGEVYRKVDRLPRFGETILAIADCRTRGYSVNDVFVLSEMCGSWPILVDKMGTRRGFSYESWALNEQFVVLKPLPYAPTEPAPPSEPALIDSIRQQFPQMTLQDVIPTIALGMAARARDEYEALSVRYDHIIERIDAAADVVDLELLRDLHGQQVSIVEQLAYWKRLVERYEALAAWTEDENKQRMAAQDGAA